MSDVQLLLAVRKALKDRKPEFLRQEYGKFKKIKGKWTRPKGHHSKMRERRKGNMSLVNAGWRSPIAVRGVHRNGLIRVMIATPQEVSMVDPKTQGIIISAAVGARKRIAILAAAQQAGISVLNIRDSAAYQKRIEERRAAMKAKRIAVTKAKEARKAPKEEKKESIETLTEEEK